MSSKKRVLGKGLSAIITESARPVDDMERGIAGDAARIVELDVAGIRPNPEQPRTHFVEEEIAGLAESIKSAGLLQPIIVRKSGGNYFVVAGERRLRASKLAGMKRIKAIIMETSEEENLTFALIENVQRTGLDPIEEAKAYRVLINRFKLKQQDVAQKVGKDRATIANLIRILSLPELIQEGISAGKISAGHAKALLAVPEHKQVDVYNETVKKGLSVRAVEGIAESYTKAGQGKKSRDKNPHIRKMEEMLVSVLGTKVEIKHSGGRGKIEINYYSLDDFDRIIELIKK
ncbi:MAG: ParB/RepB/Spo0J family partition protein [Spirochaetes bacterium]|nr:ParB/RepB/Spo0J family partition protein [Spirochaetota bacterium]